MRTLCCSLVMLGVVVGMCAAQTADGSESGLVGCVSQDPNGSLRFGVKGSGRVYSLQGNTPLLLSHLNQLVRVPASSSEMRGQNLTVDSLTLISESCTSVLPPRQRQAMEGKAGAVQKAVPVTNSISAPETTPGFQTEDGVLQRGGQLKSHRKVEQSSGLPFGPHYPDQAGQSEAAADTNATAASRAEMYPGSTLGVDVKTAPTSSVESSQAASSNKPSVPKQ